MKKAAHLLINLALILAIWLGPASPVVVAASPAQSGGVPLEPPPTRVSLIPGRLDSTLAASPALAGQSPAALASSIPVPWSCAVDSNLDIHALDFDLWVYNPQISQYQRIFSSPDDEIEPRFNHGCTKIIYTLSPAKTGNEDLYLINPDGSGQLRLTQNEGNNDYAAWSRDGTKIAFTSNRDGQPEVYTMNADGSNILRLTYSGGDENHSFDGMPAWSPDGSKIAFVSNRTGGYRIWVTNADGSNQVQLSMQPYSFRPQWSPDGSSILYDAGTAVYNGTAFQRLYRMSADGSNQLFIDTGTPEQASIDNYAGGWSPDMTFLYYDQVSWTYVSNQWRWTESRCYWTYVKDPTSWNYLTDGNLTWFPSWETYLTQAPVISFDPLPAVTPNPFTIYSHASGQFTAGIDIQSSDNNGPWQDLRTNISPGPYTFDGKGGHTYGFRARSRDFFFNQSAWPDSPQLITTIESLPPQVDLMSLPDFTQGSAIQLDWTGQDPGGSGMASFNLQSRDPSNPAWSDVITNTTLTHYQFSGSSGHTYCFRLQGTDLAHNVSSWPASPTGSACTTLYQFWVSGSVFDASGMPLSNKSPVYSQVPIEPSTATVNGAYSAHFVLTDPLQMDWNQPAYGSLPAWTLPSTRNWQIDAYLPPSDNIVQNWGFEDSSSGLPAWNLAGTLLPTVVTDTSHSGQNAALLGQAVARPSTPSAADSILSQVIQVPQVPAHPGLSFLFQYIGASSSSGFTVLLSGASGNKTIYIMHKSTNGWSHQWIDLTPWTGQSVTITFQVHQAALDPLIYLLLDEVSVGSTCSDAWVNTRSAHALPGSQVVIPLTFGNQGRIPAAGSQLTLTLPAGVTFVSASIPPTTTSPNLTWDTGDLPAQSGSTTIWVTVQLGSKIAKFTTLAYSTHISTTSTELETANNTAPGVIDTSLPIYLPLLRK